MSRTKTGRCRANRRTSREKEGDGKEIEKEGNDIKENGGGGGRGEGEAEKKNGGRVRSDALLHTRCSECYV